MADEAQIQRVDHQYLNKMEMYLTEMTLNRAAEYIDSLTATGPLYGQVILPPIYAAAKQAAMQNRGQ